MSKNCTPLWRNVHFQVKMYKTRQFRTTFQTSDAPKLVKMHKTWRVWTTFVSSDVAKLYDPVLMLQNCATLWRNLHSQVKMLKNWGSCTPLWRNLHFEVKMYKTRQFRTTFQTSDAPKLVKMHKTWRVWTTFVSSDVAKLYDPVLMLQNCTTLWRNLHSQVKMLKNCSDVAKLYNPVAKPTFASENVKKLRLREHFLKFGCRKNARRCGETCILK